MKERRNTQLFDLWQDSREGENVLITKDGEYETEIRPRTWTAKDVFTNTEELPTKNTSI